MNRATERVLRTPVAHYQTAALDNDVTVSSIPRHVVAQMPSLGKEERRKG
ncbi:hypothetical protein [Tessaracoccus sp. OH4464_COT-324]|nr:hypothetical protein [Tessaracoccus sp. OH4464_COT-324]